MYAACLAMLRLYIDWCTFNTGNVYLLRIILIPLDNLLYKTPQNFSFEEKLVYSIYLLRNNKENINI